MQMRRIHKGLSSITSVKKMFWLIIAILALLLGGIGIVLPVLPTTPFVIVAVFAFQKSVPAFSDRLRENRIFGPLINDWELNGVIATRYKIMAIVMMASALLASVILDVRGWILLIQIVCMSTAALFILSRPSA